jgi:esterase/lipase
MLYFWNIYLIMGENVDINQTIQRHGDELLCFDTGRRAAPNDFLNGQNNVILIHGFTANSQYLELLAQSLNDLNISVFLYNYNSYKGIDRAAESLAEKIESLDNYDQNKTISTNRVSIVAHSMGGLVAKAFYKLYNGSVYLNKVLTIGTPHDGAFSNGKYLGAFVKVCESMAGSGTPKGYKKSCRSMVQLLKKDKDKLLDSLELLNSNDYSVSFASISGGRNYIELDCGHVYNRFVNYTIQSIIGHESNDGLVKESSSDWTNNLITQDIQNVVHINDYVEFPDLNHSHLINNHTISLKIAQFLGET